MSEAQAYVHDPVCGMRVDLTHARANDLVVDYEGQPYAFCRGGCRRAFEADPAAYVSTGPALPATVRGMSDSVAISAAGVAIDEGMRRWHEACSCCLGDAYPEIKAVLDAERAASEATTAGPGVGEIGENAGG